MDQNVMPIGLSMALAMNPDAMREFALLSDEKKQQMIEGTRDVNSRDEMHRYVKTFLPNNKLDNKIWAVTTHNK